MKDLKNSLLRYLPSVDEVLRDTSVQEILAVQPRGLVVEVVRGVLEEKRRELLNSGVDMPALSRDGLLNEVLARVREEVGLRSRPGLRRVINATGVVLHTNLGRAVLSESACRAVVRAATGYTNLELDLNTGKRGSRYAILEGLLVQLTGAEAALVVNNNAAAVTLVLNTLAKDREVIVSRGQMVEIGGSFRIPDVMAQSGAVLVEVGTTNKTYPDDYRRAVTADTALLLHVHTSNYRIVGFTRETSIAELVSLGRELGIPVMSDLGSGSLVDFEKFGLPPEPTVQEALAAGADVVTFSGDKLLGGPQAGIILGKKALLEKVKRNPLTRAFRIDKFTVAALEATLREYLDPAAALKNIPTLRMLTADSAVLKRRAEQFARRLREHVGEMAEVDVRNGFSRVGGGAMPTAELPTGLVEVVPTACSVTEMSRRLREGEPAVLARLQDDRLLLDMRTIQPEEEESLIYALVRSLNK